MSSSNVVCSTSSIQRAAVNRLWRWPKNSWIHLGKSLAVIAIDLSAGHFGKQANSSFRLVFVQGKSQLPQALVHDPAIAARRRASDPVEKPAVWCPPGREPSTRSGQWMATCMAIDPPKLCPANTTRPSERKSRSSIRSSPILDDVKPLRWHRTATVPAQIEKQHGAVLAQALKSAQPESRAGRKPMHQHERHGRGIPAAQPGVVGGDLAQNGTRHMAKTLSSSLHESLQPPGNGLRVSISPSNFRKA